MTTKATLDYYAEPGLFTTAAGELDVLPAAVPALLAAAQGLLVHEPGNPDSATGHLRGVEEIIAGVDHLFDAPLTAPRDPAQRLRGSCRHFTVLTVATLRAHGVPSRARCGFASYFRPGLLTDHWVAEYWDADRARWVLADAQLDPDLREDLGVDFAPEDVPRDAFTVAGEAWIRCRAGELDPDSCGIDNEGNAGWWWLVGNLVRDVAALSKLELLPWDQWGAMIGRGEPVPGDLGALLDRAAVLTADPESAADSRAEYPRPQFAVPPTVYNFLRRADEPVLTGD